MILSSQMFDALRSVRSGDLSGATKTIEAALSKASSSTTNLRGDDIIDLTPTRGTVNTSPKMSEVPPQGQFLNARHGSTDYRLYIPAGPATGLPLVVMLHGCTQTPEDFAIGTGMNALADELGFIVAYPRQPKSANAQKCWNWFRPNDQQRGRGEPAQIAGVVQDVLRTHQADATRVYVAGLSAGGAAAAIMATRYPDIFAAVGIHSGLACGSANDVPSALSAMRRGSGLRVAAKDGPPIPVITFHGDRDPTVHPVNSEEIAAIAAAGSVQPLTARIEQGRTKTGRSYRRETSADPSGQILIERWTVHGAGHAWSGGDARGSHTDPSGPDASRAMLDFFLRHRMR